VLREIHEGGRIRLRHLVNLVLNVVTVSFELSRGQLTPPGNSPSFSNFGPPISINEWILKMTPEAVI
jgi:hypothetical protein